MLTTSTSITNCWRENQSYSRRTKEKEEKKKQKHGRIVWNSFIFAINQLEIYIWIAECHPTKWMPTTFRTEKKQTECVQGNRLHLMPHMGKKLCDSFHFVQVLLWHFLCIVVAIVGVAMHLMTSKTKINSMHNLHDNHATHKKYRTSTKRFTMNDEIHWIFSSSIDWSTEFICVEIATTSKALLINSQQFKPQEIEAFLVCF